MLHYTSALLGKYMSIYHQFSKSLTISSLGQKVEVADTPALQMTVMLL